MDRLICPMCGNGWIKNTLVELVEHVTRCQPPDPPRHAPPEGTPREGDS